jgi:hypothetical protein
MRLVEPGSSRLPRRTVLLTFLPWFTLLVLSAAQDLAIGNRVRIPFLHDFSAYARFLVAIPMLILAEAVIERRMGVVAAHFARSGLIQDADRTRYESALDRASRMRDSTLAEVILLGLAGLSAILVRHEFPLDFSTWRSIVSASGHTRTLAGWWYLVVGVALFQFLVWRWLWRLCIWYGFLWRMAKLDLRLIPTHPDRAAGLGFVGDSQRFFSIIVFAISATAAGTMGNEIVFAGVALSSFKFAIAGYVVLLLLVFLLPLTMFSPQLSRAKLRGLHAYSTLAIQHNQLFDDKWVHGGKTKREDVLGAPDISSLADLGSASDVLYRMRVIPFDPADALALVLAAMLPMTPLLLTVVPAKTMIDLLLKVLLKA